jgi:D-serine deaminase-like pyridoxal phosphate-dependent protein
MLERNGIACPTVTEAGTGSFEFGAASGVYTELQCGSYFFMDVDYGRNRDRDGEPAKAFELSLFVWATVMSRPAEDRAIVDAGLKALALYSRPPLVCDEPAASYERASNEHGRLGIAGATKPHRRQRAPHPRPLRPNRQSLRLVCLRPRQPRQAVLADHRPRRSVFM